MKKYLFFNTLLEAIQLNNTITDMASALWSDGITNNYSNPLKHPIQDIWAIVIEPGYEQFFTTEQLTIASELTPDWLETPEL